MAEEDCHTRFKRAIPEPTALSAEAVEGSWSEDALRDLERALARLARVDNPKLSAADRRLIEDLSQPRAPKPTPRNYPAPTREQEQAIRVVRKLKKDEPKLKYLAARTDAMAKGVSADDFEHAARVTGVFARGKAKNIRSRGSR
jgi:hypothetical protein